MSDAFVAKLDPDGHLTWAKRFGGSTPAAALSSAPTTTRSS
jgi:hypothetical protein